MRLLLLLAALILCPAPAVAQVDAIARARIDHIRELMTAADKRYEQRFEAQERANVTALAAAKELSEQARASSKEAVNKFEAATSERLAMHNGLQAKLDANPTRKEVEQNFTSLTERLNRLQERVDKSEGKDTGAATLWGLIGGGLGLIIGLAGIYLALSRATAERRRPARGQRAS